MSKKEDLQVVVDIGSSRLRVLITQRENNDEFSVLGYGIVNSGGIREGVIININQAQQALRAAIDEAERQSGYEIQNVDVGIGGAQVMGINSDAQIYLYDNKVNASDIADLVAKARQEVSEQNQQILHILAQQYILDDRYNTNYPIGISAKRIDANYHILRAEQSICNTITRCLESVGVGVNGIVSSALASSYMASSAEERDTGVCCLDIGAGTSDFLIWLNGVPFASGGFNSGGEQISSNLAVQYSTTRQYAELLKCQQGAMYPSMMKNQIIDLPHTGFAGNKKIEYTDFSAAIYQSYEKLFQQFETNLRRLGLPKFPIKTIVLAGGAAQIPGLTNYLTEKFRFPVRLAKPQSIEGLPEYLHDATMMNVLGIAKLLYKPLPNHIWEIKSKHDIIQKFKTFFRFRRGG